MQHLRSALSHVAQTCPFLRCQLENIVSREPMIWMSQYPSVQQLAVKIDQPKLICIDENGEGEVISETIDVPRFEERADRIKSAHFTGAADKQLVVRMYHTFRTKLAAQCRKLSSEEVKICIEGDSGVEIRPGGDKYTGQFNVATRQKEGHGLMQYATGDVFDGEWKQNEKISGKSTYGTGDSYEGEFKNDLRHGRGTCARCSFGRETFALLCDPCPCSSPHFDSLSRSQTASTMGTRTKGSGRRTSTTAEAA